MKMKKAISCAVAAVMCMAFISGCGGSKKQDVVKIGLLAPLTGGNAALGVGMKNSGQLAVDQANKSGKYPFKFELVAVDDAGDPSTAVAAMNKLIADKGISAITGHFNSGCALATAPVAHKAGVPFLVTGAIHPGITAKGYKEITRIITAADIQNKYAGKLAATEWGIKTIALINDRTDYGKTNAEQFGKAAEANGAKVISMDGITVGQQDFAALLTKIKATNPEAIYVPGYYEEVSKIIKQAREIGITVPMMGSDGWESPKLAEIAGKDALKGCYYVSAFSAQDKDPSVQKFIADYKAKYQKDPDIFAMQGYNAGLVLFDAIKRAGTTDGTKLAKAIAETKDLPVASGKMTFDANHNPIMPALIISLEGGVPTLKEKIAL